MRNVHPFYKFFGIAFAMAADALVVIALLLIICLAIKYIL